MAPGLPLNLALYLMKKLRSTALLGVVVVLSGCVPTWPRITPAVEGRVLEAGQPVVGATVYVVAWPENGQCKESSLAAITASNGEFSIEAFRRFGWDPLAGDRLSNWAVCVKKAGAWYLGYSEISMGYTTPNINLACELTDPVVKRNGEVSVVGLCHALSGRGDR
jgi:hypothetical protein